MTVALAIAAAKRDLLGGRAAIPLHDQMKAQFDYVWSSAVGEAPAYVGEDASTLQLVRGKALASHSERPLATRWL